MKKNKKGLIIILTILLSLAIIATIIICIYCKKQEYKEKEISIEELKYETGATAKEELYTIEKDIDGRDVLTIKKELLYKVALAGILKKEKPTYEEIDNLLEKNPIHEGIWISEEARENVISLLQTYLKNEYKIDEQGYLQCIKQSDEITSYDKELQTYLTNNKTYIIAMTGKCYTIDNMTGEIVLYPFEKMDEYQLCEPITIDNKKIIILNTNEKKKLTQEELLECIIEQMNLL